MSTMGVRCILILLLLFLAMVLHISLTAEPAAGTSIIRVPNDFPTIQEAINAAQDGSTILVDSGVYYEHLTLNKSLTLLGVDEEDTVIDASSSGDVIDITADNVVFDGFTVRKSGFDRAGVNLLNSDGSIVRGNIVTLNGLAGVLLDNSFDSTITGNIISSTIGMSVGLIFGDGIRLQRSSANNTISDNIVINSTATGIVLDGSNNNGILRNVLEENGEAVFAHSSSSNTFFHNNFIHNYGSVTQEFNSNNTWDVGGEGNYWDDYGGLDDGGGGRVAGDGVGDTLLPWHGVDSCPLISPVNPLQVFWNNQAFPASLVSNSTVSTFTFDQTDKEITFNLFGLANTTGYFNLSLPMTLLSGPWAIVLDGTDVTSKAAITENQTYTIIYLNYSQSTHGVQVIGTYVIPEYPTASAFVLLILLAMLPTLLMAKKRKNSKRR